MSPREPNQQAPKAIVEKCQDMGFLKVMGVITIESCVCVCVVGGTDGGSVGWGVEVGFNTNFLKIKVKN